MNTTLPPLQSETLYLHLPENLTDFRGLLNGLTVDEVIAVGLQRGQYRHDSLGLSSRRFGVMVSGRTAYLVKRFAQRHGISLIAAMDLLFWSGLNYRHGKDLPRLPSYAKAPTFPEVVLPEVKTRGRPKTGQGRVLSIRLTPSLETRLKDYGENYGNLLRKWMKKYVENPVPFKDSTSFQLDSGRNARPQLDVSFLPWQVELLNEIESAFGCSRSQALMKILVAIGVAQA